MKKFCFVKIILFLFFWYFSHLYAADLPLVGAIRWDAWSGGLATEQTARSLGPSKYHDRLPWFAVPLEENKVEIIGGKQEIMDKDIEYAVAAGLDYWAFLTYPENSDMSIDLKKYLSSSKRKQIKFCLILHHFLGASEEDWPKELARVLSLMQEPDYLKVCGNRPLLYFFASLSSEFHGRWQSFLASTKDANLEPYCVYMGWAPRYDYNTYKKLGFEAVSAYAKGGNKPTFAELVKEVEKEYWQVAQQANVPYIPLVSSG